MLCNWVNYITTVKYFLHGHDYLIIIALLGFSVSSWVACAYSKRKKSSK